MNSKLVSYIIPLELCLPETAAKSVRNVETTLRSVTARGLTLLCVTTQSLHKKKDIFVAAGVQSPERRLR